MKHFKAKIVEPFVLYEGEIVDIQELKSELLTYKECAEGCGRDFGLYVYRKGYKYPESSAYTITHTWHNGMKFIEHIDKNVALFGNGNYIVRCSKNVVGLEILE